MNDQERAVMTAIGFLPKGQSNLRRIGERVDRRPFGEIPNEVVFVQRLYKVVRKLLAEGSLIQLSDEASADYLLTDAGRLRLFDTAGPDGLVHRGMGSDLMALCGTMLGISGHDQVRLSYVDDQVTCVDCLRTRIKELRKSDQP